jgi:hypothetical protein
MQDIVVFTIDLSAVKQFETFFKETCKAFRRLLNDEAFEFKAAAPGVIDKHMEVRNKGFVSRSFLVEKVKPAASPDQMVAVAGSVGKKPTSARGGFSGWVEQEGGPSPAFMNKRPRRSIGKNARGGSMSGLPRKRARLSGEIIDVDELFGPTMPTEESRAQAAINMTAAEQGKGGRVILRGGGFTPGLYGIVHAGEFNKVEILQEFGKDINVKRVPWAEETIEEVEKKFTPYYIFANYIAKAVKAAQKKQAGK